jgi:hypothetical protein
MPRISKGALARQAKAQRYTRADPTTGSAWPKRLVIGFFLIGALLMLLPKGTSTYVAAAEEIVQPAQRVIIFLFFPSEPGGIDI